MRHCRASEARIPSPMASRCMAAPSGVISARLARLARCLSAFATADSVAGACATHCTEPLAVALTCLVEPHRKLADREAFFHAGYNRGARKVGGFPCRTSTSRPSSAFERLGPEVESFWSSTSSRRAGRWVRAPSLSSPKSCLSRLPFTLQHTSYPCTHPLHQSLPLPFARGRPIARDRRRS